MDNDDDETIRDMLMDAEAGTWDGDTYTPTMSAMAELEDPMSIVRFFEKNGGKNRLHLP